MYDYRKDIIDIINATNPSIEGIEAIQSIVNLLRHQLGYQNLTNNRSRETLSRIKLNENIATSKQLAESSTIDNSQKSADHSNSLTLAQYDAVQICKSIMTNTASELRHSIKEPAYEPTFGILKKHLEDCHHNLGKDDNPLTNAYYLIAAQQLKHAQQLSQELSINRMNTRRQVEQVLAASLALIKNNDEAKLTDLQKAIADIQADGLLTQTAVHRFDEFLATRQKQANNSESPKATAASQIKPVIEPSKQPEVQVSKPTEHSESADEPSFAKLLDESKVFDLNDGEYFVERRLTGAQLLDAYGQQAFFISEKMLHQFKLQGGDIVAADGEPYQSWSRPYIKRVTGHQEPDNYNPIKVFSQAVVEEKDGELIVSHDIYGNRLKVNGTTVTYHINSDRFTTVAGDIVDLAWYVNDEDAKDNMTIRWVYPIENDDQPAVKSAPKQLPASKKPSQKNQSALGNQILESLQPAQAAKKLKMDLGGQKVGIAIGDGQHGEILKATVRAYNGKPRLIDAFSGKSKRIEKQIKNLDIVILVKQYIDHPSSWAVAKACNKYGIKMAISNKMSPQSFCRALYRATNGLPADEQSSQEIAYPIE